MPVKLLLNSVLYSRGRVYDSRHQEFLHLYPLEHYEYLRIKISNFLQEVIDLYKLQEKTTPDGFIYVEVRCGMYGLTQAGLLAQKLLEKFLGVHSYTQSKYTPGYWSHKTRLILASST